MSECRPNFIVIFTDQMRADHMGCAGNSAIRTPHLDRLASDGVHFTRSYVNNPLCMPSRATLYTGLPPRAHGVRTNGIPLDRRFPTVPQALAAAGYDTGSVGKIHLSPFTLHRALTPPPARPEDFPECGRFWREGALGHVPTPYYGFEHVELTIGHGCGVGGDYANWLQREHPDTWKRLQEGALTPSPLGAEGCAAVAIPDECHHTAYVADRAIEYIGSRPASKPFFLQCSFPDPHHPYHLPESWVGAYSRDDVIPPVSRPGELDDLAPFFRRIYEGSLQLSGRIHKTDMPEEHRREILAYTYGMVSQIDHHVGRVLDCLERSGLADNTVVLFLSDHGDLMGDHGLLNKGPFHFEGLLRVPFIWRCPSRFRARQTDALGSILDVAPTILELAGEPVPEGPASPEAPGQAPAWPGRSLVPLLAGESDGVQESVVVENDEDYLGLRLRTLITATHKITTYTGHRGPEPYGELFDLANDPHELHNLWDSEQTLRRELVEQLHYRLVETDCALPRRLSHA
ncbi:MAG: sulfatase-like hydrolase/transferase [Candidatus Hydrogenedentes bacterium]|nr:sulfatase-like hydrolase/transferase [Candidatus Hydrogenedentota bacterium]